MKITVINQKKDEYTHKDLANIIKRKVCAYARVSTDKDDQKTSYDAQLDYFKKMIDSNVNWRFVGLYSDLGISGIMTKNRDGFNKMIKDAMDKKIDLIVTKSISRFARNVLDALTILRTLKEHRVEVYFEKENIYTFSKDGEVLLTLMAGFAQEESRSISENIKWGYKKRFETGNVTISKNSILGYTKDDNGDVVVDEEKADAIRLIFDMVLKGYSLYSIKCELEKHKFKTVRDSKEWSLKTIKSIIHNERYKGDMLLQKTFVPNYLEKKAVVNNGEKAKYYIENSHEGIIDKDEFDLANSIIDSRPTNVQLKEVVFYNVFCGDCGGRLRRSRQYTYKKESYYKAYQCPNRLKNKCSLHRLTESTLIHSSLLAFNMLLKNKKSVIKRDQDICEKYINKNVDLQKKSELEKRLQEVFEEIKHSDNDEATVLEIKYKELAKEYSDLQFQIKNKRIEYLKCKYFIDAIKRFGSRVSKFHNDMWLSLVDKVVVYKDYMLYIFRDGYEIKVRFIDL